jgi:putative spermidine/putrescine transport system permease protein
MSDTSAAERPATVKRPRRIPLPALLLAPAVVFTLALLVWPLIAIVSYSFYRHEPGQVYVPVFTLQNYLDLLNSFFLGTLWRTIRVSLVTTVVCAVLAYPTAYVLARISRLKSLLIFLLILPLLVGSVVRTYGWIILLSRDGLVNDALVGAHLVGQPVRFIGTEFAVVLGLVDALFPFMVLPLMSSMIKIGPALEDAALVLGARPWQVWWRVLIPMSLPGLVSGSLLVYILSMGALVAPLYLGGAAFITPATQVWSNMLATLDWPLGSAIAMALMAVIALTAFGYLRLTSRLTRWSEGRA